MDQSESLHPVSFFFLIVATTAANSVTDAAYLMDIDTISSDMKKRMIKNSNGGTCNTHTTDTRMRRRRFFFHIQAGKLKP